MAFDPKSDRWSSPCDLCGEHSFEPVNTADAATAVRCRSCGLVTITHETNGNGNGAPPMPHVGLRSSFTSLEQALERGIDRGARSVLLIGAASLPLIPAVRKTGVEVTVLVEPDLEPPTSVPAHASTPESAPFLPDQFDLIACARNLESFSSPALLFEKTRLWLIPGGVLLIGGLNWGSLAARFRRREWLRQHAASANHFVNTDLLKQYADRFGYEVKSVHTYSRPGELLRVATGGRAPSVLTRALLAPISMASNILGMGDEILSEMVKRGVAIHTLPSKLKSEPADSPGLAPALYSSGYVKAHKK